MEDVREQVTPNRHYVSRIRGGGIAGRIETTLEPLDGNATHVSLRWAGHGTNPVTWVALPLMTRRIAQRALIDLEKLRGLAESAR